MNYFGQVEDFLVWKTIREFCFQQWRQMLLLTDTNKHNYDLQKYSTALYNSRQLTYAYWKKTVWLDRQCSRCLQWQPEKTTGSKCVHVGSAICQKPMWAEPKGDGGKFENRLMEVENWLKFMTPHCIPDPRRYYAFYRPCLSIAVVTSTLKKFKLVVSVAALSDFTFSRSKS